MVKPDKNGRGFFYGWVVVGTSGLVFAIVRGVNASFGVFFVAFLEEFGWSRAAVAGAFSVARLTEGTVSVIVHVGWRWAYVALAVVVLLGVIPPTLLFQRERPVEPDV